MSPVCGAVVAVPRGALCGHQLRSDALGTADVTGPRGDFHRAQMQECFFH